MTTRTTEVAHATILEAGNILASCQDPEEAIVWLDVLEQALQQTVAVEPARLFLTIQNLAQRLLDTDSARPVLRERLMWATATLARCCVGPAYWYQAEERRALQEIRAASVRPEPLLHSSPTRDATAIDLIHADVAFRSMSDAKTMYPSIPEVLPGAMVRFSQSLKVNDPSQRLVEGQLMLVLSLCSNDTKKETKTGGSQWIGGMDEAIHLVVGSWLDILVFKPRNITSEQCMDIQMVLKINRALTGLLVCGWRARHVSLRETIVDRLLGCVHMACQMSAREADTTGGEEAASVFMSLFAEAISALSALGSNGLIPQSRLPLLTESLCALEADLRSGRDLKDMADGILGHVPFSIVLGMGQNPSEELFFVHPDTCEDGVSGLLLALVAREEYTTLVIESLLRTMTAPVELPQQGNERVAEDQEDIIQMATIALHTVVEILWGSQEETRVSSLRVYWQGALSVLDGLLSFSLKQMQLCAPVLKSLCELANACFMGLHMVIEREVQDKKDSLTSPEWDVVIYSLQETVFLWFQLEVPANEHLLHASQSVYISVGNWLEKCATCHSLPVSDFNLQQNLYMFVLKDATSCLPSELSADLERNAIRCWAKFGRFPRTIERWSESFGLFLGEAFRKSANGVYAHPFCVRLEALCALATKENIKSVVDGIEADQFHDGNSVPPLLVADHRLPRQCLQLVSKSIIPVMEAILCQEEPTDFAQDQDNSWAVNNESDTMPEEEDIAENIALKLCAETSSLGVPVGNVQILKCFAIGILGDLYIRDVSGSQENGPLCISILYRVAKNQASTGKEGVESRHASHPLSVSAAAARELANCLEVTFTTKCQNLQCAPSLLEALCSFLDDFWPVSRITVVLAVYAINTLTRIRISDGSDVALCGTVSRSHSLNSFVFAFLQRHLDSDPFARRYGKKPKSTDLHWTTVAGLTRTLCSSMTKFLTTSKKPVENCPKGVTVAISAMRVACFDWLRSLAANRTLPVILDERKLVIFSPHAKREWGADDEAMGLALSQYLQYLLVLVPRNKRDSQNMRSVKGLLHLFLANLLETKTTGMLQFLPPLIPTLTAGCVFHGEDGLISNLFDQLEMLMKRATRDATLPSTDNASSWSESSHRYLVASIFHCLFCHGNYSIPAQGYSSWLRYVIFVLSMRGDAALNALACRCLVALIDLSDNSQVEEVKRVLEKTPVVENEVMKRVAIELCRPVTRGNDPRNLNRILSKHELLALETANLDLFESETDVEGNGLFAAWLYGEEGVLSLRLGASSSRYAGWIEVVLRTAIERRRVLLKIPGQPSLESPDLTTLPRAPQSGASSRNVNLNKELPELFSDGRSSTMASKKALQRAHAVMHRMKKVCNTSACGNTKVKKNVPSSASKTKVQPLNIQLFEPGEWLKHVLMDTMTNNINKIIQDIEKLLSSSLNKANLAEIRPLRRGIGLERGITVLDRTPICTTHKIGLIYDGARYSIEPQVDRASSLLGTSQCSPAFYRFIERMGQLLPTQQLKYFSGGMDTSRSRSDGDYTLVWMDREFDSLAATSMIVYHVSSLFPESTGSLTRKSHLGNDNVLIMFCDAGSDLPVDYEHQSNFEASVVGGAFGFVAIFVIVSGDATPCKVSIRVKSDLASSLGDLVGDFVLPERDTPAFVRGLALRADLACRTFIDSVHAPASLAQRKELLKGMKRHIAALPHNNVNNHAK